TAGSRRFVERAIHDSMLEKVIGRAQKYPQGDPLDPKTRVGAQTSEAQIEKISRYVEIGKKEGAKLVLGGEPARVGNGRGYFWKPTIFDQVTNTMTIAREEIFGPVLSVISFDDFDRALEEANDSFYGLSAAVWTRDIKKAHRAARMLQAGPVWINTYHMYDAASAYVGYEGSGFGRESGMPDHDSSLQTKRARVD